MGEERWERSGRSVAGRWGFTMMDDAGAEVRPRAVSGRVWRACGMSSPTSMGALRLSAWQNVAVAVAVVVVAVGSYVVPVVVFGGGPWQLGVMFVAVFGLGRMSGWVFRGAVRQTAVRACTSRMICPSCFYDLLETERDAKGLAVCPECGAVWRLPAKHLSLRADGGESL